jgi:hypothetical protein
MKTIDTDLNKLYPNLFSVLTEPAMEDLHKLYKAQYRAGQRDMAKVVKETMQMVEKELETE